MLDRCENAKDNRYSAYGARGISVCQEWHDSVAFINWALSNGYSDGLQLDRVDTNGDYEPNNCRFITCKENNRNKRNNHVLTINGETMTVTGWAEKSGVKRKTIFERLKRGWSEYDAVFKEVRQ